MDIKSFKQDLLNKLYEPYRKCMQCPLGTLGRTHVVFGEGNADAKIMVVGEGPGQDEDRQGRPFVGRSGKLLTQTFSNVGISRVNVYITNVVKCRPPNNRTPLPLESTTCKNLLLFNQIKIINPSIIITLGAIALQAFAGEKASISQVRGKIITINNICIIPTYHPAYILRNPKELPNFTKDIKSVLENLK
jgi:DNA polymerase